MATCETSDLPKDDVPNDDVPPPRSPNRHNSDDSMDYETDLVRLLEERQNSGRYCGSFVGKKIVFSNLGFAFNADVIQQELKRHLLGVQSIEFGHVILESKPFYAGHGCITFDSIENAVKGMVKLDNLCLDVPGMPIPRPIMSFFPMFEDVPWKEGDIPGYVFEYGLSPHFCQSNTLEYDVALEWKHLQKCLAHSKKTVTNVTVKQMLHYLKRCKNEENRNELEAAMKNEPTKAESRSVVCKGVSTMLDIDQIRMAVEISDQCDNIRRVICPVTGKPTGTVFIEVGSTLRAKSIVEDTESFMFILGASPRPVEAELVRFGPSKGFEGVLDRAIEMVMEVDFSQVEPSHFMKGHVVEAHSFEKEKKELMDQIRKVLDEMLMNRFAWKMESMDQQKALHTRQKDWIESELKKLEKLERVVPKIP